MTFANTLCWIVAYFAGMAMLGALVGKFLSFSSATEPLRDRDGYIVRD